MSFSPNRKEKDWHHTSLEDEMQQELVRHAVTGGEGEILTYSSYHTCEQVTENFPWVCTESEIFNE